MGLILCSERGEALVRYALDGLPSNVMAGEYRTTLHDETVLAAELDGTTQAMELREPLVTAGATRGSTFPGQDREE